MRHVALIGAALAALVSTSAAHAGAAPPAFAQCAVCHNAAKGTPDTIGPNLWGVYGTIAGTGGSYAFSKALKDKKLKLDDAGLGKWLEAPMTLVPGTRMAFAGVKDAARRKEIIAYLKTLR